MSFVYEDLIKYEKLAPRGQTGTKIGSPGGEQDYRIVVWSVSIRTLYRCAVVTIRANPRVSVLVRSPRLMSYARPQSWMQRGRSRRENTCESAKLAFGTVSDLWSTVNCSNKELESVLRRDDVGGNRSKVEKEFRVVEPGCGAIGNTKV